MRRFSNDGSTWARSSGLDLGAARGGSEWVRSRAPLTHSSADIVVDGFPS